MTSLPKSESSPFGSSSSKPGHGVIKISILPPAIPTISTLSYTYPLKLIAPSPTTLHHNGHTVLLIFLLTYGGGLVAGDAIDLSITLAPSTRLALVTQGSTKIFKSLDRSIVSKQTLDVRIGNGAGLCYLPDPTQPFAESCYEQKQVFTLEDRGSLCVLDWVSEGRSARGEKWNFWRWNGKNEVWTSPSSEQGGERADLSKRRLLLRDNVILDTTQGDLTGSLIGRIDGLGVFGTLIIRGALFDGLAKYFMDEFTKLPRIGGRNWSSNTDMPKLSAEEERRAARHKEEAEGGLLWTAASVRGLVVVKFGAREVEGARRWLGNMLREEGSVQREFGDAALLCLR
ncbi:hypothetical protein MMC16_004448 [Acarospora aff. strigata]|nr:hypothetical protein [Acarospora aff. strigata]